MPSVNSPVPLSSDDLDRLRDSVIAQIERDFADVTRKGGVSLHETQIIDDFGSEEECTAARLLDTEIHWSEVKLNEINFGFSVLSFLDPIGFRYYFAAFMVFSLKHGNPAGKQFIASDCHESIIYHAKPPGPMTDESAEFHRGQFSLFNDNQFRCVARFLAYEVEMCASDPIDQGFAFDALKQYGMYYLPTGEQIKLRDRWPQLR